MCVADGPKARPYRLPLAEATDRDCSLGRGACTIRYDTLMGCDDNRTQHRDTKRCRSQQHLLSGLLVPRYTQDLKKQVCTSASHFAFDARFAVRNAATPFDS